MKASCALQAAEQWGGYNPPERGNIEADIWAYFTPTNFANMFGKHDNPNECGGYTLQECIQACIDEYVV